MTALPFQGGSGAWPLRKTAAPLLLQSSAEVEDYQWGSLLSFRTPQLTMLENASKKVLYGTSLCLSQTLPHVNAESIPLYLSLPLSVFLLLLLCLTLYLGLFLFLSHCTSLSLSFCLPSLGLSCCFSLTVCFSFCLSISLCLFLPLYRSVFHLTVLLSLSLPPLSFSFVLQP